MDRTAFAVFVDWVAFADLAAGRKKDCVFVPWRLLFDPDSPVKRGSVWRFYCSIWEKGRRRAGNGSFWKEETDEGRNYLRGRYGV